MEVSLPPDNSAALRRSTGRIAWSGGTQSVTAGGKLGEDKDVRNLIKGQAGEYAQVLRLRRIELIGFKSFSDKGEIVVNESGVTAIVGPNGCGKRSEERRVGKE